ncbi:MAG: hypothetical protein H0X39_01790 [Actinobacteria bacterium]|nr:hypothetical protein [Actinomycetota bacterium]
MAQKPHLSRQTVEKMRRREASVGLESDDDAAQWLDRNDSPPPTNAPKSLGKNKLLHQWAQPAALNRRDES